MKKVTSIASIQTASRKLMQQLELLAYQISSMSSISQYHALLELHVYKVMNMIQLSRTLHLEQSTTSRLVMQLVASDLCTIQRDMHDRRNKLISLTPKGLALAEKIHAESRLQVEKVVTLIGKKEQEAIAHGLTLYNNVLSQSRLQEACKIRKASKKDLPQLAKFTKLALTEYGLQADRPATAINKRELEAIDAMYATAEGSYFLLLDKAEIVGGGGYGKLSKEHPHICVVRGLYLASPIRCLGLGTILMQKILRHARSDGFTLCYSEDYGCKQDPANFYKKLGFKKSDKPLATMQDSTHSQWYVKEL